MTTDFAKNTSKERNARATRTSKSEKASLPVRPFVLGSIFGVFLCLGVQWFLDSKAENIDPADTLAEPIAADAVTGPVLDFYTKLREVEVMVPDEDTLVVEEAKLQYLLQAGSFRDAKDADSMRAQLILLNLDADISKFNHNGEIWHRVIVGPFAGKSAMSKTRTTLLENGIESLLLTQPVE